MAHVVKVEPGDVLVLANVGDSFASLTEQGADTLRLLKASVGLAHILVFRGDVNLSKLPPGWTPPEGTERHGSVEASERDHLKLKTEAVLARLRDGIYPGFDGRF